MSMRMVFVNIARKRRNNMYTVYSLPTCTHCKVLKKKMEEKGLEYKEIQDMKAVRAMGFMTVPVLVLEDGTAYTHVEATKYINSL